MKRTLLFLCFYVLSFPVFAAELSKSYWVIGSFSTPESAKKEVSRLGYWITQPIRIAAVKANRRTNYRLLVTDRTYQSQKNQLNKLGISPWKTRLTPSDLDVPMVTGKSAEKLSYVLVLAGFRDEALAEQHAESLRRRSEASVDVVATSLNNSDYYRVVSGPYNTEVTVVQDQFVLMGIDDAWWLDVPVKSLVTRLDKHEVVEPQRSKSNQLEESNTIPVIEASVGLIPDHMVLRAPKSHESYVEYCIQKATFAERKRYCGDGDFISQSQRRIEAMGESALFTFCATKATGGERKEYCKNEKLPLPARI